MTSTIDIFNRLGEIQSHQQFEVYDKRESPSIIDKPVGICARVINYIAKNVFGFYKNTRFTIVSGAIKDYFVGKIQTHLTTFDSPALLKILNTLTNLQNRWKNRSPNFFQDEINAIRSALGDSIDQLTAQQDNLREKVSTTERAFTAANGTVALLKQQLASMEAKLARMELDEKLHKTVFKAQEEAFFAARAKLVSTEILQTKPVTTDAAAQTDPLNLDSAPRYSECAAPPYSAPHSASASPLPLEPEVQIVDVSAVPRPFDDEALKLADAAAQGPQVAGKSFDSDEESPNSNKQSYITVRPRPTPRPAPEVDRRLKEADAVPPTPDVASKFRCMDLKPVDYELLKFKKRTFQYFNIGHAAIFVDGSTYKLVQIILTNPLCPKQDKDLLSFYDQSGVAAHKPKSQFIQIEESQAAKDFLSTHFPPDILDKQFPMLRK